jgi:hypothetical protein
MLNGSIDPNSIRRKTDPESALPDTFAQGSLMDKYQLPKSAYRETNNVSLLQKSRSSYENYKNRFQILDSE